jgi:hypothetical protein
MGERAGNLHPGCNMIDDQGQRAEGFEGTSERRSRRWWWFSPNAWHALMRGSSTVVVKGSQAWDLIEPVTTLMYPAADCWSPVDDADGPDADGKTPGWRKESKDIWNREPESNIDPFAP